MRVVMFTVVASLTILTASGLSPSRAYGLALSAPSALSVAIAETSLVQDVGYVCHRWWDWHGARWVRTCWRAGQQPPYGPWNGPGWYEPSVYDWGW
jgi:hypothetical protein